jgi:hypothetical protein
VGNDVILSRGRCNSSITTNIRAKKLWTGSRFLTDGALDWLKGLEGSIQAQEDDENLRADKLN